MMISKNDSHIFNKFVREYKMAINKLQIGECLNKNQILSILHFLGYVDEFINDQSEQTAITITYMLSQNQKKAVSQQNLFKFLMIISNIRGDSSKYFQRQVQGLQTDQTYQNDEVLIQIKIGSFSQSGEWVCTEQQKKKVKELFGSLNLKRISRDQIQVLNRKSIDIKTDKFQPTILKNSQALAQRRYSKLKISKKVKVQDRLLINQSMNQSRLQSQINKSKQKQMKQCFFQPKINKSRILSSSLCKYMNSSVQNKENVFSTANNSINKSFHSKGQRERSNQIIGQKLLIQGKVYEQNISKMKQQYERMQQQLQLKECTFQPKLCKKVSLGGSRILSVKNTQKQIQRMKQARKKREFQNAVKERGYPALMSWTKYFQQNKTCSNHNNCKQKSIRQFPILRIDLKIKNQNNNINVYEGQCIRDVIKKICIENSLPNQSWRRVEQLIYQAVNNCNQVRIIGQKIRILSEEQAQE